MNKDYDYQSKLRNGSKQSKLMTNHCMKNFPFKLDKMGSEIEGGPLFTAILVLKIVKICSAIFKIITNEQYNFKQILPWCYSCDEFSHRFLFKSILCQPHCLTVL